MPVGYNSLPLRTVNKYTAFLKERMGMGLYPYQLQSDPWRAEYVHEYPGYIWRPFIPIGRFQGTGEHPIAKHLSNSDSAFAKAYRRIYGIFTESKEDFIVRMNNEMGLYGDDVDRDVLYAQLAPGMTNVYAASMIMECDLVLNEGRNEQERRLVDDAQRALMRSMGTSYRPKERAPHDDLFGIYFYIETNDREPLTNAVARFQSIALALRYPQMRHHAALYMRQMAETYPPIDAMARHVVEDHLRAAWALITNEPRLRKYWVKASKYLTSASTLVLLNEELFDSDTSKRIDEFQELIGRIGRSGEGLQYEARSTHINLLVKK